MFSALLCYFVLTLAMMSIVVVAAYSGGESARPTQLGRRLLIAMGAFALLLVLARSDDWVHLQWSVTFPMWGMFTGAGLLLLQTWPRDRARRPEAWYGQNGATIALVGLFALGVLPPVLAHALREPFPVGRTSGSSFAALLDVVRCARRSLVDEHDGARRGALALRSLGRPVVRSDHRVGARRRGAARRQRPAGRAPLLSFDE